MFEFFCDIALGIHQCLLTNPLLRNFIAMCISNFDVISEDIIETNFIFLQLEVPVEHDYINGGVRQYDQINK